MKITLVCNDINEETINELAAPIGLCYLAGYAEKYMPGDISFSIKTRPDFSPGEDDSDIIGISSMSRYFPNALKLAKEIKAKREIPVLIGGYHISSLPHTLPECFDIGVIGEGELTFIELLKLYKEKGKFTDEDLSKIDGIAYHGEGKVLITPPRAPIEDMDSIPFPKRDLWDLSNRVMWLSSSRGCPFNCVFCAVARCRHREFSADYVAEELLMLQKKYNPRGISFHDDLFMLNPVRLEDIIRQLKKRGFNFNTNFGLSLRADFITPDAVRLLKELNVITVFIGIESASEKVIAYLKGGKITVGVVQRALDLLKENNIMVEGSFIIGSPPEEREDLVATYKFIVENYSAGKLAFILTNLITPYPGSRIWQYAKDRNIVTDDMDFSKLNMALHSFDPYNCTYLNENIPLTEFVDYIDMFEKLHYDVNRLRYKAFGDSFEDIFYKRRLDRERLRKFKEESLGTGNA
ncbi:MAG: B12-binding domain-containing radical SAM protein [Chloroflexi bacterium]|nr:B12-binding domain-containing radical SAM protein [Chloroflexota bacterium]